MNLYKYLSEKYDPSTHIATSKDILKQLKKIIVKRTEHLEIIDVALENLIHNDLKLSMDEFGKIIRDLESHYDITFDKDFFTFNNKKLTLDDIEDFIINKRGKKK